MMDIGKISSQRLRLFAYTIANVYPYIIAIRYMLYFTIYVSINIYLYMKYFLTNETLSCTILLEFIALVIKYMLRH